MSWIWIPLGLFVSFVILAIIRKVLWKEDPFAVFGVSFFTFVLGLLTLLASITCPTQFYSQKQNALMASQYYENIVKPSIISEGQDYVTISNPESAIWQAGGYTLVSFNNYLTTTRYWAGVPIIGSQVYPVPEGLKYVRVGPAK